MTVQISNSGVTGDLDLFSSEARFLRDVLGLEQAYDGFEVPAAEIIDRSNKAIDAYGLQLRDVSLGRPTSLVADDHLFGIKRLAEANPAGTVKFF